MVESYGNWTPPGTGPDVVYLGTVQSDGATYNMYRTVRINQPWILGGTGSFYQYWSVRTSKKPTNTNISGIITFSNHVKAWEKAGLVTGDFNQFYQVMESEGYESKGSSSIRVSFCVDRYDGNIPDPNPIYLRLYWDADKYMYTTSDGKLSNSSTIIPPHTDTVFDMQYLYYEHVDFDAPMEWVCVVAFKSKKTGKYLTVKDNGVVVADGDTITDAQKFYHVWIPYSDCFKSLYNNKYLDKNGVCSKTDKFDPDATFCIRYDGFVGKK